MSFDRPKFWLLYFVTGCGYVAPLYEDTEPIPNTIKGSILANGITEPSDAMILVYDADDPPPPHGTGSPVALGSVPHTSFSTNSDGILSASYAVTGLNDGQYTVAALLDMDGDFNPFATALAGSTCGDQVGAHVTDLTTLDISTVEICGGTVAENISILVGTEMPFERPAFTLKADQSFISLGQIADTSTIQTFVLQSTGVHTAFSESFFLDLEGPCTQVSYGDWTICDTTSLDMCETAFWVYPVDADGDGAIDPHPDYPESAGLLDIWPRVYLSYLGDTGEGESYTAEAFPLLAEAWTAAALGNPDWYPGPVGSVLPIPELSVTWLPIMQHTNADGETTVINVSDGTSTIDDLPSGDWSVTVVSHTGQTWTLPNEIGTFGLTATAEGFDPTAQGAALVIE